VGAPKQHAPAQAGRAAGKSSASTSTGQGSGRLAAPAAVEGTLVPNTFPLGADGGELVDETPPDQARTRGRAVARRGGGRDSRAPAVQGRAPPNLGKGAPSASGVRMQERGQATSGGMQQGGLGAAHAEPRRGGKRVSWQDQGAQGEEDRDWAAALFAETDVRAAAGTAAGRAAGEQGAAAAAQQPEEGVAAAAGQQEALLVRRSQLKAVWRETEQEAERAQKKSAARRTRQAKAEAQPAARAAAALLHATRALSAASGARRANAADKVRLGSLLLALCTGPLSIAEANMHALLTCMTRRGALLCAGTWSRRGRASAWSRRGRASVLHCA
jgi:hypothetical protein